MNIRGSRPGAIFPSVDRRTSIRQRVGIESSSLGRGIAVSEHRCTDRHGSLSPSPSSMPSRSCRRPTGGPLPSASRRPRSPRRRPEVSDANDDLGRTNSPVVRSLRRATQFADFTAHFRFRRRPPPTPPGRSATDVGRGASRPSIVRVRNPFRARYPSDVARARPD